MTRKYSLIKQLTLADHQLARTCLPLILCREWLGEFGLPLKRGIGVRSLKRESILDLANSGEDIDTKQDAAGRSNGTRWRSACASRIKITARSD